MIFKYIPNVDNANTSEGAKKYRQDLTLLFSGETNIANLSDACDKTYSEFLFTDAPDEYWTIEQNDDSKSIISKDGERFEIYTAHSSNWAYFSIAPLLDNGNVSSYSTHSGYMETSTYWPFRPTYIYLANDTAGMLRYDLHPGSIILTLERPYLGHKTIVANYIYYFSRAMLFVGDRGTDPKIEDDVGRVNLVFSVASHESSVGVIEEVDKTLDIWGHTWENSPVYLNMYALNSNLGTGTFPGVVIKSIKRWSFDSTGLSCITNTGNLQLNWGTRKYVI